MHPIAHRFQRRVRVGGSMVWLFALLAPVMAGAAAPAGAEPTRLDTSFGIDGKVIGPIEGGVGGADDVAVDPGQGIIAVGAHRRPGGREALNVLRLSPDGREDPLFRASIEELGSLGIAARPLSVAIQEVSPGDWKVLIAGIVYRAATYESFLLRLSSDGSVDRSFGTLGQVFLRDAVDEWSVDVLVDAQQRILLLRRTDHLAITRFLPEGARDPSFGEGGSARLALGPAGRDVPSKLFVDKSQRVGVVGSTSSEERRCPRIPGPAVPVCRHPVNIDGPRPREDLFVARFTDTGKLDVTFGEPIGVISSASRGFVVTSFDSSANDAPLDDEWLDRASSVALQDGRILVVGTARRPGAIREDQVALARFDGNGQRDATFGDAGALLTKFGSFSASAEDAVTDASGRIIVTGYIERDGAPADFLVARLSKDGLGDPQFLEATDFRNESDAAESIALQGEQIIVAGTVSYRTDQDQFIGPAVGLSRYLA